jgi:hypothetical protein
MLAEKTDVLPYAELLLEEIVEESFAIGKKLLTFSFATILLEERNGEVRIIAANASKWHDNKQTIFNGH